MFYIPASVINAFLMNVCPRGRYIADCAGCPHWSEDRAHCQHPQHPQYASEAEREHQQDGVFDALLDMAEEARMRSED